ncbi:MULTISPECIES: LPD28 domain-containing protein [unclassified Sporosarcina]|uniref:LPD28 domain-containing protein n=1 Tax=unclassified Sporosarcina TaxID=2647733 RepID=UPI001A90CF7C|nr:MULTISPECIES: LPD28 domain-containing protein [unclassified Sporosarcina]MBO0588183.1 hypothetical protein [Sporosarcina sp. E16_8]MBO0601937.1 hypothetical protein [Sporosarcina sp. E16_3]
MKNSIQNVEIVFSTSLRIPTSERDENLFYYEIRHDDECQDSPCEIANFVFVNHLATIATSKPLHIDEFGFVLSDDEKWDVENVLYGLRAH